MSTLGSASEIVEATEEVDSQLKTDKKDGKECVSKSGNKYSIEDDINKLFQAINVRHSARASGPWRESSKDALQKSAMKKPMRASTSKVSGIGISEPVSLKQALRGLCISQASEMAAMKRLSRPGRSSGVSEAGTIKRLYRAVVAEANGSGLPMNEGKGNFVEISLVPDTSNSSQQIPGFMQSEPHVHPAPSSTDAVVPDAMMTRLAPEDQVAPLPTAVESDILKGEKGKLEHADTSSSKNIVQVEIPINTPNSYKGLDSSSSLSGSGTGSKLRKSSGADLHLTKPVLRSKNFLKKNTKQDSRSVSCSSKSDARNVDNDLVSSTSNLEDQTHNGTPMHENDGNKRISVVASSRNLSVEMNSCVVDRKGKPDIWSNYSNRNKPIVANVDERLRSREKGDFSQSSKSSMGDYSSTTSTSEESTSGSGRSGKRPHMSRDLRWEAIHHVQKQHGSLGLRNFKLLRRLGSGDIGTVYLGELIGTNCVFAVKVMDNECLATKNKMVRAQTEREILEILDHPFLPTLYAHCVADKLSCLVMEYCPGGDLHVLRQKQPCRSFCEQAARYSYLLDSQLLLILLAIVALQIIQENLIMVGSIHFTLLCSMLNVIVFPSSCISENYILQLFGIVVQKNCLILRWCTPCFHLPGFP